MSKDPITEKALILRLKKHLKNVDGQILKKSRGKTQIAELGQYYTQASNGFTVQRHIELEQFARQEKVLHAHEFLLRDNKKM